MTSFSAAAVMLTDYISEADDDTAPVCGQPTDNVVTVAEKCSRDAAGAESIDTDDDDVTATESSTVAVETNKERGDVAMTDDHREADVAELQLIAGHRGVSESDFVEEQSTRLSVDGGALSSATSQCEDTLRHPDSAVAASEPNQANSNISMQPQLSDGDAIIFTDDERKSPIEADDKNIASTDMPELLINNDNMPEVTGDNQVGSSDSGKFMIKETNEDSDGTYFSCFAATPDVDEPTSAAEAVDGSDEFFLAEDEVVRFTDEQENLTKLTGKDQSVAFLTRTNLSAGKQSDSDEFDSLEKIDEEDEPSHDSYSDIGDDTAAAAAASLASTELSNLNPETPEITGEQTAKHTLTDNQESENKAETYAEIQSGVELLSLDENEQASIENDNKLLRSQDTERAENKYGERDKFSGTSDATDNENTAIYLTDGSNAADVDYIVNEAQGTDATDDSKVAAIAEVQGNLIDFDDSVQELTTELTNEENHFPYERTTAHPVCCTSEEEEAAAIDELKHECEIGVLDERTHSEISAAESAVHHTLKSERSNFFSSQNLISFETEDCKDQVCTAPISASLVLREMQLQPSGSPNNHIPLQTRWRSTPCLPDVSRRRNVDPLLRQRFEELKAKILSARPTAPPSSIDELWRAIEIKLELPKLWAAARSTRWRSCFQLSTPETEDTMSDDVGVSPNVAGSDTSITASGLSLFANEEMHDIHPETRFGSKTWTSIDKQTVNSTIRLPQWFDDVARTVKSYQPEEELESDSETHVDTLQLDSSSTLNCKEYISFVEVAQHFIRGPLLSQEQEQEPEETTQDVMSERHGKQSEVVQQQQEVVQETEQRQEQQHNDAKPRRRRRQRHRTDDNENRTNTQNIAISQDEQKFDEHETPMDPGAVQTAEITEAVVDSVTDGLTTTQSAEGKQEEANVGPIRRIIDAGRRRIRSRSRHTDKTPKESSVAAETSPSIPIVNGNSYKPEMHDDATSADLGGRRRSGSRHRIRDKLRGLASKTDETEAKENSPSLDAGIVPSTADEDTGNRSLRRRFARRRRPRSSEKTPEYDKNNNKSHPSEIHTTNERTEETTDIPADVVTRSDTRSSVRNHSQRTFASKPSVRRSQSEEPEVRRLTLSSNDITANGGSRVQSNALTTASSVYSVLPQNPSRASSIGGDKPVIMTQAEVHRRRHLSSSTSLDHVNAAAPGGHRHRSTMARNAERTTPTHQVSGSRATTVTEQQARDRASSSASRSARAEESGKMTPRTAVRQTFGRIRRALSSDRRNSDRSHSVPPATTKTPTSETASVGFRRPTEPPPPPPPSLPSTTTSGDKATDSKAGKGLGQWKVRFPRRKRQAFTANNTSDLGECSRV